MAFFAECKNFTCQSQSKLKAWKVRSMKVEWKNFYLMEALHSKEDEVATTCICEEKERSRLVQFGLMHVEVLKELASTRTENRALTTGL
jgi:hypothetical protein